MPDLQEERKRAALEYHEGSRPGKLEIVSTKPTDTQRDLSLAYSPGVAFPCLEIAENEEDAFRYTGKGNLVGVISNGSAVLGLGNIGPLASKPVMEGKGVLFKRFADVDVFDIEVDEDTVEGMVKIVKSLEPTFGGVNLEDIKAPECFEIETQLREIMDIPVFHDDQHGTAIIASAGFLNAIELSKKKISQVKVVFSGAGAASIACAKLFLDMGVKKENLYMTDSKGVIYKGRKEGMNKYKDMFANDTSKRTLTDVMDGADAFIGCSAKGIVSKEMVKTMAKNPIIFAMANPDPEITPEEVAEVRDDAIMATGRSDYPNQVNNVLGFPFIFRGALDVKAKKINEEMKLAAVKALADLAKEEVPEEVKRAYGDDDFSFGKDYLIPKPFDKRVLTRVAPAVAKAAMDSGVARQPIGDLKDYALILEARLGSGATFIKSLRDRINKKKKKKILFAEGSNTRILQAVSILIEEGRTTPILLGEPEKIRSKMDLLNLKHLNSRVEIIDPETDSRYDEFALKFFEARQRKGVSLSHAKDLMGFPNYFASMLVKEGFADGMITGTTQNYPECVKPLMRTIGTRDGHKCAGIIILVIKDRVIFLADCTMQINPGAEALADIALATSKLYKSLMRKDPSVAFLSFSNFGSNSHPEAKKMADAVSITKARDPKLVVDGEMQADVAVNSSIKEKLFNFSSLKTNADVLIFPNLDASNICYKLMTELTNAEAIGPVMVPMNKAVNIVQRTATVNQIVNMSTLTALIAQEHDV